jgi:BMFP domain-containing protein YqiC
MKTINQRIDIVTKEMTEIAVAIVLEEREACAKLVAKMATEKYLPREQFEIYLKIAQAIRERDVA